MSFLVRHLLIVEDILITKTNSDELYLFIIRIKGKLLVVLMKGCSILLRRVNTIYFRLEIIMFIQSLLKRI